MLVVDTAMSIRPAAGLEWAAIFFWNREVCAVTIS